MNALNEKIEKVEMFRDTYFHMYPEASATDRSKAVREAALLLLEVKNLFDLLIMYM